MAFPFTGGVKIKLDQVDFEKVASECEIISRGAAYVPPFPNLCREDSRPEG